VNWFGRFIDFALQGHIVKRGRYLNIVAEREWQHFAIYRVGDVRVGQWSKPVSVTVGG
jgi:hypothetical protein